MHALLLLLTSLMAFMSYGERVGQAADDLWPDVNVDLSTMTETDWEQFRTASRSSLEEKWTGTKLLQEQERWHGAPIVLTDLDGTFSPFPDFTDKETSQGQYWIESGDKANELLRSKGVAVMVTTGNPIGMASDRYSGFQSGVFSGGADVRWNGTRLANGTELAVDSVNFFRAIQDQTAHRHLCFVWMSAQAYYVALDEHWHEKQSAWDDALLHIMTANLLPGKRERAKEKFNARRQDINKWDASQDDVQVLYIKGLGTGKKDAGTQANIKSVLEATFGIGNLPENTMAKFLDPAVSKVSADGGAPGGPEFTMTLVQTSRRWEFAVLRKGVSKDTGKTLLQKMVPNFRDRVVLVAGDSGNDVENAEAVVTGGYPNAIFVATADENFDLSPVITGRNGEWQHSSLSPEEIAGEVQRHGLNLSATPEDRIFPGFVFDAMYILAESLN